MSELLPNASYTLIINMIGHHPFVIVTLLLIYSHSSRQSWYTTNLDLIRRPLRNEKPTGSVFKSVTACISKTSTTVTPASDIVCDRLDRIEKQLLCDEAMEHMIAEEHGGGGTFGSFVAMETNQPAPPPPLANPIDPQACAEISIKGFGMKKRMYWCKRAQYRKFESDETGTVDGFFISGSRKRPDRAFIFTPPSTTNSDKVCLFAKMERVSLLSRNMLRCEQYSGGDFSSSQPIYDEYPSPDR